MAPTIKPPSKLAPAMSMTTNSNLAQRSNTCQNFPHINITNPANQLDSTLYNNGIKPNIIITYPNIKKL